MPCKPTKQRNVRKRCFLGVFRTFFRNIPKTCTLCSQTAVYAANTFLQAILTNCEQSKAVSSFSLFLQITAVAPKTGKSLQKRVIYAFRAFSFNNTCTSCHQRRIIEKTSFFCCFLDIMQQIAKTSNFWEYFTHFKICA